MKLVDLLAALPVHQARGIDRAAEVTAIVADSRLVAPGALFVAVAGEKEDGARYVDEAVRRGARAVVLEARPDRAAAPATLPPGVATIAVPHARRALGLLADRFHGEPSREVSVVGITGTNGKTTTSYLVASIARAAGEPEARVGTIEYHVAGESIPAKTTTPPAELLHRLIARHREKGGRTFAVEVSSHALEQDRVAGVRFRVAAFTNLTRDHLDYHETMESYRDAKSRLFAGLAPDATAVLNAADRASAFFARATRARVLRYGASSKADVRAHVLEEDLDGTRFRLSLPGAKARLVRLGLPGRHNVENALAAAASAHALGISPDVIAEGLSLLAGVPGRLERVGRPGGPRAIIDYAHTDDALERVLRYLRGAVRGRLVVVFGCGGDRDRGKRPRMAAAVERFADRAIVTSDNPRSEDPLAIIAEVVAGFRDRAHHAIEADRARAIRQGLREASGPHDLLVVAGKGHEEYQIVGGTTLPFSDRDVAREAIDELLLERIKTAGAATAAKAAAPAAAVAVTGAPAAAGAGSV